MSLKNISVIVIRSEAFGWTTNLKQFLLKMKTIFLIAVFACSILTIYSADTKDIILKNAQMVYTCAYQAGMNAQQTIIAVAKSPVSS